jgi:hypothetical protein
MAIGINHTTLLDMLATLNTQIGGSATLTIMEGTQPATGGTATTALAVLTCSSTFGVTSGVALTANVIGTAAATVTGTATWARIAQSGGTQEIDMSCTATGGGGDLLLNTTAIVTGATVSISSCVITAGNQ